MVSQKYRWDFIGLSTDDKPTSETSDKVVNGSTYYCSDTSKLYVYCDGTWYERKPLGGGGISDFNDLSNRPKYNGSDMTGSTNIPEVKTYTAGSNVAISDQNVISATDTTYTAGTNVSISDQNVISATDTTYSAFTGTDGTAAGAAGLVPAPATTDAGKFLKADGTWEEVAGGGGITELTSADYNYPAGNPTSVALWLLENGVYYIKDASVSARVSTSTVADRGTYIVADYSASVRQITAFNSAGVIYGAYKVTNVGAQENFDSFKSPAVVQTAGASTASVMSQNAVTSMVYADPSTMASVNIGGTNLGSRSVAIGYNTNIGASYPYSVALGAGAKPSARGEVNIGSGTQSTWGYNSTVYRLLTGLYDPQSAHDAATKGYVDPTTDSSAPTTATVGRLGQIQIDTTNNDAYMCVAVDDVTPTYTWKKITV